MELSQGILVRVLGLALFKVKCFRTEGLNFKPCHLNRVGARNQNFGVRVLLVGYHGELKVNLFQYYKDYIGVILPQKG